MFLTLSIKAIGKQWTVSLWQGTVEFGRPYNRMLTIVPGQKWKDLRTTLSPTFSAFKIKQVCMCLLNILSVYNKTFRYTRLKQGHPTAIFGKYLFGRRFEISNFGTFVVKFLACLPLLRFSNIYKMV